MNILTKISKKMSYYLRHNPEGLLMDEHGWVMVSELVEKLRSNYPHFDIDSSLIEQVVLDNDKQRFAFNDDYTLIRANQGHTINVDLALDEKEPPNILYHGTPVKNISAILSTGLNKMKRQHVHLSKDIETAAKVGARRGKYHILTINSKQMYNDGYKFYISKNEVWLTDVVPSKYISNEEIVSNK